MENIKNALFNSQEIVEEGIIPENHSQEETQKSLSKWEQFKCRVNQVLDTIHLVRCVACFTSICSTISFLIMSTNGSLSLVGLFGLIGILSALIACPFKLLGITVSLTVGGFSVGLCFMGIGCIIGAVIGLMIGVIIAIYFPAFVAIPYFFKELRFRR